MSSPRPTLRPFAATARPITLHIAPARDTPADQQNAIDTAWAALRRDNPALHDGPILAVESACPETARVLCRRSTYRHLAVAATLGLDTRLLGVRGLVTATDRAGDDHLLLGRRAAATRVYPRLWETAPAGGMAVPPAHITTLDEPALAAALVEEGLEEVGLDLRDADLRSAALLADPIARSEDILMRLHLRGTLDPALPRPARDSAWEYADAAWVPVADLAAFDARHGDSISPPTRTVLRRFGWVPSAER